MSDRSERDAAVSHALKALIFDVDGTLYRQRPLRWAMLRRLLFALVLDPRSTYRAVRMLRAYRISHEQLREKLAHTADLASQQLRRAAQLAKVGETELAAVVQRWFYAEPLGLLQGCRRDGVVELLLAARQRGIRIAAVSDYPAEEKLRALGIREFFGVVVCAQDPDVQALKPDPRGLRLALERLGVSGNEALYIGDRPDVDAEAAGRAGVTCAILGRGRSAAGELRIRHFHELYGLLAANGKFPSRVLAL